jgi:hypothetical protein
MADAARSRAHADAAPKQVCSSSITCGHSPGGGSIEDNIQLRCRAHNQYEADLFFGEPFIARESWAVYWPN